MTDPSVFVIGTRGSPLALAQAHQTQGLLEEALGLDLAQVPLRIIRTTGDAIQDRPLSEAGGKGLFTKELDEALMDGRIDLAVHSAKDLPTALPPGLTIAGYLPREDARDAFLPAVGQGAIAIVTRSGDDRVGAAIERILDRATGVTLAAERSFLAVLDGSCRTPIAGHSSLGGARLSFRGLVLRPDRSESVEA